MATCSVQSQRPSRKMQEKHGHHPQKESSPCFSQALMLTALAKIKLWKNQHCAEPSLESEMSCFSGGKKKAVMNLSTAMLCVSLITCFFTDYLNLSQRSNSKNAFYKYYYCFWVEYFLVFSLSLLPSLLLFKKVPARSLFWGLTWIVFLAGLQGGS